MSAPLYKLSFYQHNPAFGAQMRRTLQARLDEQRGRLGIRLLLTADTAWSNRQYDGFSVELHPGQEIALAAAQAEADGVENCLGCAPYLRSESYLGIPMDENFPDFAPLPPPGENEQPIYRVYFSRPAPGVQEMDPSEVEDIAARTSEMMLRAGIRVLLSAYMRWSSEEWDYFGIERFPSLPALISYSQFLSEYGWYRITQARSFLGIATGGILVG